MVHEYRLLLLELDDLRVVLCYSAIGYVLIRQHDVLGVEADQLSGVKGRCHLKRVLNVLLLWSEEDLHLGSPANHRVLAQLG